MNDSSLDAIADTAGFFFYVAVAFLYVLPSLVAASRQHKHTFLIAIVNIAFGYTVIGWFAAMMWSITDDR